MQGDKLASGAKSASFVVAPDFKYDKEQMQRDLTLLPVAAFCEKYMVTQREYEAMRDATNVVEELDKFASARELIDREIEADEKQESSLRREVIVEPFVAEGCFGRVLVTRDVLVKRRGSYIVAPPKSQQKRTLLPTTGHIVKAKVYANSGDGPPTDVSDRFVGRRVVFGQMSGAAICFQHYPTWILLELSEIMAWVTKEDVDVMEEELEPMV